MHTLFHSMGCSLVPGWGSKISHAEQHGQRIFFLKLLGINETNFQHLHEMGAKAHLEEPQTRQTATAKENDALSVLMRTLCFHWQRYSSQSSRKNSFIYPPVLTSCSSLISSPLPKIFLGMVIFQTSLNCSIVDLQCFLSFRYILICLNAFFFAPQYCKYSFPNHVENT